MNASLWKWAVDFIVQQSATTQNIQSAATADDSGPPQVNYGADHLLA